MNKNQLIGAIAAKANCSKEVASECCDAMLESIMEAMRGGDKVTLPGFGNFEVKTRAARVGVNPATGAKIDIPESKVISFKPAKASKDTL
ncbi:MAG: HU family DNA-binding protein [Clostridia bacterium]|nr:HU family DNA-binding protein [Clostridia bacterium]